MPDAQKLFPISHTRLNRTVEVVNSKRDPFNPMAFVIDFEYVSPTNFYLRDSDVVFGLYVDREFKFEFRETRVKVQLEVLNTVSIVEIFAHPHEGFIFTRARQEMGNKIRIKFRSRNPNYKDIVTHDVLWDNKTGSFVTKKMGIVDAETGEVTGAQLKEGALI